MNTDKKFVLEYFNTTGFERWRKIYSDSETVSKVQLDIREGHQRTVDQVLYWLKQSASLTDLTKRAEFPTLYRVGMDSTARLILDIGFYGFQRCAATGNNALGIMPKLGFF